MIEATISLLGEVEVTRITSRMIAERSGTATNYITRYFGGRDALLAATAEELGRRVATGMEAMNGRPDLAGPLELLEAVIAMPEVGIWFSLFRYLSGRNLTDVPQGDSKPPLVAACEDVVARIFGIEGDDVQLWSNVFLTYIMGGLAFNPLLGTSNEEGEKVLAKLARIVELLRDNRISLDS
jgi:AcrR family transcriptional regulator